MRIFLHDILFTLLLFIAILIVADVIIPLPTNRYSIKRDYLLEHSNDTKTLVIGNSLAENGFDTHILGDSAYCFAMSGRSLYYDNELMKKYLPTLDNLQTVILLLHYNLINYQDLNGNKDYAKDYIYSYYKYFSVKWDTSPYGYLYRSAILSEHFHLPRKTDSVNAYGNAFKEKIWDGNTIKTADAPLQQDISKCIDLLGSMGQMLYEK